MTEKDGIGAEICYGETNLFLMVFNLHMYNCKFLYLASSIMSTVSVVYLEWVREVMGLNFIFGDEILVN